MRVWSRQERKQGEGGEGGAKDGRLERSESESESESESSMRVLTYLPPTRHFVPRPRSWQMLVPVSRGISRADDKSAKAKELRDNINAARARILSPSSPSDDNAIEGFQRDFINFSLDMGVLKFGTFTLKSGRESPYFFNAGLFSTGAALFKLGKAYAASIMSSTLSPSPSTVTFDVIFGPAYKGISLGAVVAAALYSDFGVDVGFAYNRKEAKDHGEGGTLVGASMEGKKVLVVDDVISAGTAIRESYGMLTKIEGCEPVGVSIALDRAEKRR